MYDKNQESLDTYSSGWSRGDCSIILSGVEDSYTFSGLPNMEPVDKMNFKMFWVNFRSNVEDGGGPKSVSSDFMKFKNVIRRQVAGILVVVSLYQTFFFQVGESVVETGQWIVPGFAEGVYMTEAKDGKIMWEEATM